MDARVERVWSPQVAEQDAHAEAAGSSAWIIGDDDEVIVIDPGQDAAAVEVAERDETPVALHRADLYFWRAVFDSDDPEIEMADGGRFDVADVRLEVIATAGHTPGSVSFYCEDLEVVFTGDTLSAGGPVPHEGDFADFPRQLTAIGERLLDLPPQTRVLPGHGEETTIADASKRFDGWVSAGPGGELS